MCLSTQCKKMVASTPSLLIASSLIHLIHLIQKIAEFNAKKQANQKQIEISDAGLELIEFISVDCTNTEDVWMSDHEIKIDRNGYMIINGEKTKQFWDGTVTVGKSLLESKSETLLGMKLWS